MSQKQKLFAFLGVRGSGKDYRISLLKQQYSNLQVLNFKDPLVEMCQKIHGTNIQHYEDFKQSVLGCIDVEKSKKLLEIEPNLVTGRILLQRLGTEVLREYDPDIWTSLFIAKALDILKENKPIACGDLRFPNELEALCALRLYNVDVQFTFCDYKSFRYCDNDPHISERMAQMFKIFKKDVKNGEVLEYNIISDFIKYLEKNYESFRNR